jgi:hypothetical protein
MLARRLIGADRRTRRGRPRRAGVGFRERRYGGAHEPGVGHGAGGRRLRRAVLVRGRWFLDRCDRLVRWPPVVFRRGAEGLRTLIGPDLARIAGRLRRLARRRVRIAGRKSRTALASSRRGRSVGAPHLVDQGSRLHLPSSGRRQRSLNDRSARHVAVVRGRRRGPARIRRNGHGQHRCEPGLAERAHGHYAGSRPSNGADEAPLQRDRQSDRQSRADVATSAA